eukprot:Em0007g32a
MADESTGKKTGKKKNKPKALPLNEFLAAPIATSTAKEAPLPKRTQSWADESEHLESDDTTEWPSKPNFDRTVLPSAPRAATAVKVDLSRLPSNPPYTVYLGNLAYDCSEEDIKEFFQRKKVQVSNVRLPKEGTTNRPKGFGYAELGTRQDLEEALALTGESLKNRTLKIDLAGGKNQDDTRGGGGGYGTGRREEYQQHDDDRTSGNWRTAPADDEKEGDPPRRNDDSYNNHSSTNREGGYRDGGHRDGGDRYSQQSRGEGGERRGYGEGGGERRGYGEGERRGYGEGGGERRGYGDRGGRRDGPSDRGGPPGYGDRGRYSDRRPEGGRYERGPGHSEGRYGDSEERRPREDDRRRRTPERDAPAERPKLHLVPRSKPKEEGAEPVATSSIFGGAKPVDTATREKEIEERLLKEKEEVKSPKEKAATSSIFGGAKPVDTAHREREIEERLRKSQEAEEVPSRSGEERQSRLHSNEDEKSLQTTEASPHQDEPSDSGTKKVWSSKSVHNTDHTQRGTETREGGGRGRGTYTVYLGNLAYECDTRDIEEFFEKRSVKVTSVRLPKDASTNRVRGFGYAELPSKEDLDHALSLDGETLRGRALKVDQAKDLHGSRDESRGDRDRRSRGGSSSDDQHGPRHKEEKHGRQGEERSLRSGDQDKRPPRENPWKGRSGPRSTSPPPPTKEKAVKGESTQEVVFSRPSRFAALDQDSSGEEHNED